MNQIRALKDPEYRANLSADELAEFVNPAGIVELAGDQLDGVSGGTTWFCATVALTATVCSPSGTLCGSCQMGTNGCC